MTSIFSLIVGPLQANCYLLSCPDSGATAIIDPGGDPGKIQKAIEENSLKPCCIINTHAHPDHTAANAALKAIYRVPLWIHGDEASMLEQADLVSKVTGISFEPSPAPDRLLRDGDELGVGSLKMRVLHTPGHSPGGICLLLPGEGEGTPVIFTGDTVFAGSVGRTDLPGGSSQDLLNSIMSKIITLPGGTRILPGHGPETTVEHERQYNPFF